MCLLKLNEFLEQIESEMPALQAELVPNLPQLPQLGDLPQLPELNQLAAGLPPLAMAGNLALAVEAAGGELAVPGLPELAKLEAMAQINGELGANALGANGQAELNLAAGGVNINAPALGELAAALPPLVAPVAGLPPLLATVEAVQAAFGVNLMAEGAMPQLALQLEQMAAGGGLDAAMQMAAGLPAGDLGILARLLNASAALGIDLTAPGGAAELAAALEAAASLEAPPVSMAAPEWTNLIGLASSLEAANAGLGVNLTAPGASAALAANLPTIEANLANLEANLQMPLGLSAGAEAELSAAAEVGMQLAAAGPAGETSGTGALPTADLGGLPLGGLPNLEPMSLAATFAAAFEAATGVELMSSVPCPNVFCVA